MLSNLRETLLPKLMSGELRIPDRMLAKRKTINLEQTGAIHAQ